MSLSDNMHIINGYNNIPDIYKNSVIAIGNFDGIHLGHKHLLNKVLEVANAEGKKSGIITFDPHPKAYFGGLKNFHQVTTDAVKIEILEKLKIDVLFELNFDKSLSKMSPEEFFLEVIIFTVSPFLKIFCSSPLFPLISHPIAVSPTLVWTA